MRLDLHAPNSGTHELPIKASGTPLFGKLVVVMVKTDCVEPACVELACAATEARKRAVVQNDLRMVISLESNFKGHRRVAYGASFKFSTNDRRLILQPACLARQLEVSNDLKDLRHVN